MFVKSALLTISMAAMAVAGSADNQLAFPGAQGWGRFAKGARSSSSPTVYHVTNLNDSGTGSLRDAVSQANRIVVFDVSGVINISSRIVFKNNLYVAGQTAPGEGITVYGDGVSFSGSDNIICRYLRIRMGHNGSSGKDCAGVANGYNMIFDHCSFSWGLDETFSINAFGLSSNITLQNCIIGQGLMLHSAGGLMQCDSITLYRNLYIDNSTRNNKIKGTNQYANNIVYNWSNGCYLMGGDSEGTSYVNIESNCFINGPSGGGNCFTGGNANFHCYGNDNWQDNNKNGVYDPYEVTDYNAATRESEPYDYPTLELYPGNQLIEKNIPTVGASLPYRDQSDCYMIDELMSFGKKGELISNEEGLAIGAPSTWEWWSGDSRTDTDGDGMPDVWEDANGTNKNSNDATTKAANGYLNIENYINSITADDRQYFLRKPITLSATSTTSTMTLTWRDYTYAEEGFEVSYKLATASDYTTAGTTDANATTYTITGLKDGVAYDVRVRAVGSNAGAIAYSGYASGQFKTRPIEVGIVDIDSYEPDVTNSTEVAAGQKLLLKSDDAMSYAIASPIYPSSVVAIGNGQITVSGDSISGETTSVNKGGEGTLTLNSKNAYRGATVLHAGVLEFNSLANGGVYSALGSSQEFAQNWIMDGGTYRYTGTANASTDRSAKLTNPTTLEITNGKTLTMSGAIEGSGDNQDFTLAGNGQLTVASTGFFAYTGTTTLKGGTLYLSTTDIAKAGLGNSSKLVMAGGKLSTKGETSSYETYSFPIEVAENTYSYFAPYRNCYMKNALSGYGILEVQIPYLREYFDFNTSNFHGRIVANGVGTDSWGSLMLKESSYNIPTTIVTLKGNAKLCVWATVGDSYLGGLAGDAGTYLMGSSKNTDGTTCSWTIGSANSDEQFDGVINNSCCASGHYCKANNITKVGTGLWRLTGKNIYQGATTVKEGTLIINGTHTGSCGYASATASTYVVANGATLKGTGKIQSGTITVQAGGTLMAGDTVVANKVFTLTGTTTNLQSGAILCVPISYYGTTKKSNTFTMGTLNINSGAILKIDMSNVPSRIAIDTKFQVFSGSTKISGTFGSIEPATPGEGLQWDLSELYTNGCIYVREEGAEQYTYVETNLFGASQLVDGEGYYWFNQANDSLTQQYVKDSVICFDEAAKASLTPTYEMKDAESTVLGTGAIKMSKTAAVTFRIPGDMTGVKLALYRSAGTDWAQIYASYDGIEWTTLGTITSSNTEVVLKNINYFDFTTEDLISNEYCYLKIEQANGASPTYVAGIAINYLKKETGLEDVNVNPNDNLNPNLNPNYDLQGRRAGAKAGFVVNKGNKSLYYK